MDSKMKLPFAVLAAVPFVMVLGNSMLIPVLPVMQSEMNLTTLQAGLIITAFSIPAGLTIPFAGTLSDHVGRRAVMAPALVLYGAGGLVAGFAALLLPNPFGWIMGARIAQGIGAGGTYQLSMALTGDLFQSAERSKALGLLEAANGAGKVISPILGSLVALIIWFAPFFLYGLVSIPVAAAVWWVVKEPKTGTHKQSISQYWKSLKGVFQRKGGALLSSYLTGMVALFLLFGVLSYLSDVLEKGFGIAGFTKGFVLAIPVGALAATSYTTGSFLQDRTRLQKPAIIAGLAAAAVAMVTWPLFSSPVGMVGAAALMGIGIGLVLPPINNLITGATSTEERGVVTSLYGTVRFFGVALGPPAFSTMAAWGRWPLFLTSMGLALAALGIGAWKIRPAKMQSEQAGGSPKGGEEPARSKTGSEADAKSSTRARDRGRDADRRSGRDAALQGGQGAKEDPGFDVDAPKPPPLPSAPALTHAFRPQTDSARGQTGDEPGSQEGRADRTEAPQPKLPKD